MKKKKITRAELDEFLRKHKLWLMDDPEGERADLRSAKLRSADLRSANLRSADLRSANLYGADLGGADLGGADLRSADLGGANLYGADLGGADLRSANLYGADLGGANLYGANLGGADLGGAKNIFYPIACPEKGEFVGFKKASGHIVELLITEDAKRCSATSRKCRCSKAKVISITNIDGTDANINFVASSRDCNFIYTIGEYVEVTDFNDNRWDECSAGIHFFITRQEAVNY